MEDVKEQIAREYFNPADREPLRHGDGGVSPRSAPRRGAIAAPSRLPAIQGRLTLIQVGPNQGGVRPASHSGPTALPWMCAELELASAANSDGSLVLRNAGTSAGFRTENGRRCFVVLTLQKRLRQAGGERVTRGAVVT